MLLMPARFGGLTQGLADSKAGGCCGTCLHQHLLMLVQIKELGMMWHRQGVNVNVRCSHERVNGSSLSV